MYDQPHETHRCDDKPYKRKRAQKPQADQRQSAARNAQGRRNAACRRAHHSTHCEHCSGEDKGERRAEKTRRQTDQHACQAAEQADRRACKRSSIKGRRYANVEGHYASVWDGKPRMYDYMD